MELNEEKLIIADKVIKLQESLINDLKEEINRLNRSNNTNEEIIKVQNNLIAIYKIQDEIRLPFWLR
jgi:hypothetical protein